MGTLRLTILGFTGAVATVYAYQADVTTEDNRSVYHNRICFHAILISVRFIEITYILTQPRINVHRGGHRTYAWFIAEPMDWSIDNCLLRCHHSAPHLHCLCLDLPSSIAQSVLQTPRARKVRKDEKTRNEASWLLRRSGFPLCQEIDLFSCPSCCIFPCPKNKWSYGEETKRLEPNYDWSCVLDYSSHYGILLNKTSESLFSYSKCRDQLTIHSSTLLPPLVGLQRL